MQIEWKTCLKIGITGTILFLIYHYWDAWSKLLHIAWKAAFPLLLGCVFAYVLNILMSFFETKLFSEKTGPRVMKLRRPVCILLAFASIIFILFLVVQMVIPELISCLQLLFSRLPGAFEQGAAWLEENFELTSMLQNQAVTLPGSEAEWQELLGKLAGTLVSGAGNIMGIAVDVISSAVSKTINVAVAAVFSIYLLAGKEKIGEQIGKLMGVYLPRRISGGIGYVLQVLDSSFHHFIVGQCVEAVILGLLCVAGMLLLRLPYAAMLGSLVGVTALIPVAGAYIGGAVGFFMIFTVDPIKAVFFLIFLVALQQLEGNLIYPRVVGSSIGLPGIWVLAAVTVGGGVAGVGGMLLGVPVTATVYQLLKNDVQKKTLPKSKKSD